MDSNESLNQPAQNKKTSINIDLRLIVILLILVIAGMLITWRPWAAGKNDDRTVSVSGEAKIEAEPDQFVFMPTYEIKNANKDVALKEITAKSEEVVDKLKALGVADTKIKTNADGYDYGYFFNEVDRLNTYTLRLTVTVDNREFAQKIQDYLVTTTPQGQVTPQASFSDEKRKQLESKARDDATKDARAKAEQSANNLGFKVGKVKSIADGTNHGIVPLLSRGDSLSVDSTAKPEGLEINPGENEFTYSVEVTYYIN